MKTTLKLLAALLLLSTLNHPRSTALAQGANFTYQGRLNASGSPANGLYDLTFALYNTNGTLASAVLNLNTVTVSNGLFTTALNFNSGNSSPFNGQDLLLEIAVRTNGGGTFSTLSPRQPLTPAPYAIYSATASGVTTGAVTSAGIAASTITAGNIAGGQVVKSLNGLKDVVALAAGANVTLTTNGNTLTLASSGGAGSSWLLAGNGGTTPGVNFLGTTDNLPLELKVNGTRAFRLEPTPAGGTPNVIGGAPYNYAAAAGIFIGGGGASGLSNSVGLVSDYAVISGGLNNSIGTNSAYTTIAGGHDNGISYNATDSTIGGGDYNNIQPYVSDSVIAGGDFNLLQTGAGFSAIGGGYKNTVAGGYSTIAGGYSNLVSQSYATVAGGDGNTAGSDHGTVGGGQLNVVNNHHSTIGGGRQNSVSAFNSTIGGGFSNFIRRDSDDSVVAGGNGNAIDSYDGPRGLSA